MWGLLDMNGLKIKLKKQKKRDGLESIPFRTLALRYG